MVKWSKSDSPLANARKHLPLLAEDYFRAGRKILASSPTPKTMHKLRLRTKHFRYTLELFQEVYGATMEKRLALLKPLQDALGELNDCVTARDLLGSRAPMVRARLKQREREKMAAFDRYWREKFDAPGQSEAWLDYLG